MPSMRMPRLCAAVVKRYPARPLFLVTRIRPVTSAESGAGSAEPKKDAAADGEEHPRSLCCGG